MQNQPYEYCYRKSRTVVWKSKARRGDPNELAQNHEE